MKPQLYEIVFGWYLEAERELTINEIVLRSKTSREIRKLTRENARLVAKKVKKVYRNRWNEIYDTKLGIVHEPAPAPVQAPAPAPAPELEPEVDPLEALRVARASREEEHE
jgi:hypothetical protein